MISAPRHLKRILAALALVVSISASAIDAGCYASNSVLASGRWVKIKVSQTGMQEITAQQLSEMGFNNPSRVGVYGFSAIDIAGHSITASTPDDLPAVPSILVDNKIVFYGESGIRTKALYSNSRLIGSYEQNPLDLAGYYLLHESDNPLRLDKMPDTTPSGKTLSTAYRIDVHAPMETNPWDAGVYFLSRDIATLPESIYQHTFSLDNPADDASSFVSTQYISSGSKGKVRVHIPSEQITEYTNAKSSHYTYLRSFTDKTLSSATPSATVAIEAATGCEEAYVNYIALTYRAYNRLLNDNSQIHLFYYENIPVGTRIKIGSDSDVEVWKINRGSTPQRCIVSRDEDASFGALISAGASATSTTIAEFIAFNPSKQLCSVEFAGELSNSNLHAMSTPDMLIVTTSLFCAEAERLAALHRSIQGLEVEVVDVENIYNEFSSSTSSIDGIRRFVKMLYDRNPDKLKHLLLIGTATSNPRCIGMSATPADDLSHVPAYACELLSNQFNDSKNYVTDAVYGKLADGTLKVWDEMNINVGRIPSDSPSSLSAYIDKVADYLTNIPATELRSRALVVADRGNQSGHVIQCEELCDLIIKNAPSTYITKVYDPIYEYDNSLPRRHQEIMAARLKDGISFMAYAGHGNHLAIGSAILWNVSNVLKSETANPPFVMLATCNTFPFDQLRNGSLCHEMIFARHGGAIALIGAARTVQMNFNHQLSTAIVGQYYTSRDKNVSLGDIFRLAHNDVVALNTNDLTYNTLSYNYGGDPALPLYSYTRDIVLDEGHGTTLTTRSTDNIISGTIVAPDGSRDESFQGTICATLYSPENTVPLLIHQSTDILESVDCNGNLVAIARAPIEDGRFTIRFDMPYVGIPGEGYRLQLGATNSRTFDIAATAVNEVTVNDPNPEDAVTSAGPRISSFSVEDFTYNNGGVIGGNMIFRADISPDTYSIACGPGILRGTYIEIDGIKYNIAHHLFFAFDGSASLVFPMSNLADGDHTATLSVADYTDTRSEAEISFTIVNHAIVAQLQADTAVAHDEVTFSLDHGFDETPTGRLSIVDHSGNTVFTATDVTFPFVWDLNNTDGERVADGRYRARAWISLNRKYVEATPVTVHVIE